MTDPSSEEKKTTMTDPLSEVEVEKLRAALADTLMQHRNWSEEVKNDRFSSPPLSILLRYPSFANQEFQSGSDDGADDGTSYRPLCFFLMAGANLEMIQEVYNIYPQVLQECSSNDREDEVFLPLHLACKHAAPDVIAFIAQKYPKALAERCDSTIPIHLILNRREDHMFPVIKLFVELCPDCVGFSPGGKVALEFAVQKGCHNVVLAYLLDKFPRYRARMALPPPDAEAEFELNGITAARVGRIVPRLKTFWCHPSSWTSYGFSHAMECVKTAPLLVELVLRVPAFLRTNVVTRDTFTRALSEMPSLEYLGLDLRLRETGQVDDLIFTDVRKALVGRSPPQTPTIIEVWFQNFVLGDANTLGSLLSATSLAKAIVLSRGQVESSSDGIVSVQGQFASTVERLVLQHCHFIDNMTFTNLMAQVLELPSLQSLELCPKMAGPVDITSYVTKLLHRNKLKSLWVGKSAILHVDSELFCNALKADTSLKSLTLGGVRDKPSSRVTERLLDVLEVNTSCGCVHWNGQPWSEKIDYLTNLNRYGRKAARDPGTLLSELVDALGTVAKEGRGHYRSHEVWQSTQYGLLRESPGLWCHALDQRNNVSIIEKKRKFEKMSTSDLDG